jgi:hypothetical protein
MTPVPRWATVEMPRGAQIVRVGQQNDEVMVWALVDPSETAREVRRLLAAPTGWELNGHLDYLGTTEVERGRIVVHVFEVSS